MKWVLNWSQRIHSLSPIIFFFFGNFFSIKKETTGAREPVPTAFNCWLLVWTQHKVFFGRKYSGKVKDMLLLFLSLSSLFSAPTETPTAPEYSIFLIPKEIHFFVHCWCLHGDDAFLLLISIFPYRLMDNSTFSFFHIWPAHTRI